MKKLLYFFLPALVLAACAKAPKPAVESDEPEVWKSSLEQMVLQGKVKSLTETHELMLPDDFTQYQWLDYEIEYDAYAFGLENDEIEYEEDEFYYSVFGPEEAMEYNYTFVNEFDERGMLVEERYRIGSGKMYVSAVHEFDEYNRTLREEYYDADGSVTSSNKFVYDKGHLVMSDIDAGEGYHYRTEMAYNARGKMTESKEYRNDEFESVFTCEYDDGDRQVRFAFFREKTDSNSMVTLYDSAGNEIERRAFDMGKLMGITRYSYNAAGKQLDMANLSLNGDTADYTRYEYDEAGHETLMEYFSPYGSDTPVSVEVHKYDKNGNQIFYSFDGDKYHTKSTDTYDRNNKLLVSVIEYPRGVQERMLNTYDKDGRIIERQFYKMAVFAYNGHPSSEERLVKREKYTYDKQGNWVLHNTYFVNVNGQEVLLMSESRSIEYYQ